MLEKLKSRKFLMALLSVIVGVATMIGCDDASITLISGIGLIVIPTIIYIVTEGKVDMAAVNKIVDTASQIVDLVEGSDDTEETTSETTEETTEEVVEETTTTEV